jgi:hypothetical protein
MQRMLSVKRAVLFKLKFALSVSAILAGSVIFPLAFGALKRDKFNSGLFSCHNAS